MKEATQPPKFQLLDRVAYGYDYGIGSIGTVTEVNSGDARGYRYHVDWDDGVGSCWYAEYELEASELPPKRKSR